MSVVTQHHATTDTAPCDRSTTLAAAAGCLISLAAAAGFGRLFEQTKTGHNVVETEGYYEAVQPESDFSEAHNQPSQLSLVIQTCASIYMPIMHLQPEVIGLCARDGSISLLSRPTLSAKGQKLTLD